MPTACKDKVNVKTLVLNTRVWFCARFISFRDTARLVFMEADTTTIRLLLAWSSFWSALGLIFDDDKFQLPAYAVVAQFGNEKMWTLYFLAHFIGVHWRVFERSKSRPRWALAINCFGFAIWFVSTVGIAWAVGGIGIPIAMSMTLCMASAWALYRTGLGKDVVTL